MKLYIVSILYVCTFLIHCSSEFRFKRGQNDDRTALHDAIRDENYDVARNLIERGESSKCRTHLNIKDNAGNTALYEAANKDFISDARFEIIKLLLEHCADPNIAENNKWTPLMQSARYGNARVVKLLLDNGANIHDGHTPNDRNALHEAVFWGHVDAAKILIEHASDVNAKDTSQLTTLHFAVQRGHVQLVRLLLQNGANVNAQNIDKRTALHDAISNERYDIAKILIEHRTDISDASSKCRSHLNIKDKSGNTALYDAANKDVISDNRFETIKLLLEHCADPNIAENNKWTPLMQSARYGNVRVVKLLLDSGASTHDVHSDTDRTALHEAAFWSHTDAAKLLIEHAANVNAKDKINFTPLHFAVQRGNDDLAKLLLQHGAKRNAKNWEGASPYDIAKQTGNVKISDLFEKAMLQNIESACESFSTDYIHNGELAKEGEFPWMAALGYVNERDYSVSFDCGGTIISNLFVLSAAHCVKVRQPSIVRMGKISLIDVDDEDEFRTVNRHIQEIISHPNHSSLTKRHDIALLRLKKPIPFSANVRPACLQIDARDEPSNMELIVTGWGLISTKSHTRSNDLRKAQLITMPLSQCNRTLTDWGIPRSDPALRDGLIDGQYCAYDPQGRNDSCQGDSGGPLQYFPTKDSTVATVVGIISFGIGCGSTLPAVYTRVAHYLDWIEPIVWSEL